jgi:hypothetical protein
MTYSGTVQNGVIHVEGGIRLPEGAKVQIEVEERTEEKTSSTSEPTIGQKLAALGRWAESQPCDLPTDLAENHDHYIHGLPKRQ